MPRHCPFPVRSTDSRRSYHTGSAPGFTLCLALVAALSGYAGFSHAAPAIDDAYLADCQDSPVRQIIKLTATENRDIALSGV